LLVMGERPDSMPGAIASILNHADRSWRIEGESAARCIAPTKKGSES